MENVTELIRNRRSVRSYDGRALEMKDLEKLRELMQDTENPYALPVKFELLNAKEHGLLCPVVSGTETYVGGKIKKSEHADVAFGYSFEMLVLHAWSLGIGTVWLGGTMNRPAFETAMGLGADEIMPCASPLGYVANKMSMREGMMRKAIKADERLPFERLFFDGNFDMPLTKEKAGSLALALEMVRLAPSAVNKQPWRVVACEGAVHFYLKRSKGITRSDTLDMQKIDMGIALCHFALTAKACGLRVSFSSVAPAIKTDDEYIASYLIAH
ncbi:MAG: nitroreductase [Clostridia bacterium]|nr:nitroreductase [Clostridia bacterium]